MNRALITAIASLALVAAVDAQKVTEEATGTGGSPHVKAEWTVQGAAISIEYGRPYLKGRPETQLMPPGQPWRTGADQPTLLTTDKPLLVGTLALLAGTYTLNTIPGPTAWQLLVGRNAGQWGIPYRPDLEIGRVPMTVGRTSAPVEQVTLSVDQTATGGRLQIEWGSVKATVPFTVGSGPVERRPPAPK